MQFFELLLDNGFSILSFDLDGHGYSSTTLFDPNDFEFCFEFAFKQIKRLNSKPKSIFVCGQSLGAILGYSQLNSYSNELKGFVGIGMPLAPPNLLSFLPEVLLPLLPTFWQQLKYFSFYDIFPPVLNFKRQLYPIRLKNRPEHYVSEISAYISKTVESLQQSKGLPQCLFIHGQFDKIATAHTAVSKHYFAPTFDHVSVGLENHYSLMLSARAHQITLKWLLEKIDE